MVDHRPITGQPSPFAPLPLRRFITTTSCPAPILRIGTLGLAVPAAWAFSLHIGDVGSHVPNRSLCRVHAAYMPATIWTVSRFPPDCSRDQGTSPVLMAFPSSRHVLGGLLAFVSIGTHLTGSSPAFSVMLTTLAFGQRSLRWFEAPTCMATSRGHPLFRLLSPFLASQGLPRLRFGLTIGCLAA